VKTSMDDQPSPPQNAPLIMLLVRDPATGDWASHMFGRIADSHTRPIVLLDQEHNLLHMFATGPSTPGTIAYSGTIYEKTSPLDNVSFASGVGTPVIRDVASADMNNVTSTKQNVNSTTGLVVLASNDTTSRYWHADESLGTTAPTAPTASFTAAPTSGVAPLSVAFTDTSTGPPTSWSWAFGDGGTSSAQHPTHTYTAAGTYTVSLTATNAAGSDTTTRTGYVTVTEPVATQTFAPSADSYVNAVSPGKNYGNLDVLKVRQGTASSDTSWRSYLQFNVTGMTGPVTSVKLRLYVTDSSVDGGDVYAVSNSWTEAGLTWNNAPTIGGTPLARAGAVTTGTWAEIDLGATAVSGNGTYSFALKNAVTNSAFYNSREAASNPPQLIVTQS